MQRDARLPTKRRHLGEPAPESVKTPARSLPSFPELFSAYAGFVRRVLLRSGVAESDIEDVAQDVFLSVYRALDSFEGRCLLRTWIYGITQRRAVDYHRRISARPDLYAVRPSAEQSVDASQERDVALAQERMRLRQALDELDHHKRTVFILFDIEGRPMEEIAAITRCPVQTAYSRLYAARRKLEALHVRAPWAQLDECSP